ncbi:hypothetical protein [Streptomyces sp. IB201691-2A2]|uniref:hypothetical protein n=1 Tax=Streptomyces sp. IB201691-2A2 TaxID=2561920 RepID=UPI0011815924|nr:hypothetical protein [Streptomyces sp. IB201691-2A2]TRO56026.1 hypothetical protein E4K73_48320 [Streptomyces sp. IB201691-2A2]
MAVRAETDGEPTPFWKQRGWILAAGFLATVLIVSLFSAVTGDRDNNTGPASASVKGPLAGAVVPSTGRPKGCRTDDGTSAEPKAAPQDLKWRTVGGTQVPTSPSAGPTQSSGPLLWCFAHTPMGAVLAAHVIPAQMTSPAWREAVDGQVVAGFGRDLFAAQRATLSDRGLRTGKPGRYMGFALTNYDDKSAKVDLLIKSSRGSLATTTVSLRWSTGDWKIEPGNDGGLHSGLDAVSSADGFVPWRA